MTGDESAQRHDHPTQVGEATIDQLRAETAHLARKFPNAPRLELFNGIRLLRDRVFHYLDGRLRTNEHRDLYFLAGAACGMLVTASDDLGYPGPAMSHARAALMFAKEAGSDTLTAWIYSAMANVCYWNHQHAKACDYARQGQRLNPAGSIAVLLPAIEARAIGQLGDEPASRAALDRVTEARESVRHGDLDDLGGIMSFSHAKQDYYAATAYFGIGSDPDVVSAADRAVAGYESGPAEERAYDNMAIVQFHAAVAHVRSGDVDAAADYARPALSITPDHRNALVDKSAILLHDSLRAPRVRTSQVAIETRDQVEDFLSVSAGGLELS